MKPRLRHLPFYLSAAAGLLACGTFFFLKPILATLISANVFFAAYLIFAVRRIPRLSAVSLRTVAADDDVPASVIFLIMLFAAAVSLAALFYLLNTTEHADATDIALSFMAVPLGWACIHMMAALHYAHLYWSGAEDGEPSRGLDFPGTPEPGGIEFVYFSFVIGLTAQTSDVAISSSKLRTMNVVHAIVSFFFNTVLLAAAVNAAISLSS